LAPAPKGGNDLVAISGAEKRPWIVIGLSEEAVYGGLEVDR